MKFKGKKLTIPGLILLILVVAVNLCLNWQQRPAYSESVQNVPDFSGNPYVVINDNQPEFTQEDRTTQAYEYFSLLDSLGRCGYTMACVGTELMPTEDRESISHIKPSGWVQAQYDIVDGNSLYNRCHLIGFQLTGENDNERNLITGTRYMNVEGMLPFENMVADYIKETGNHVLFRVIPVFDGDNLVADGVTMEAWSVEDEGEGICFYVYIYNVQPGVQIDYATGESWLADPVAGQGENTEVFVVNTSSGKFHLESCSQWESIKSENRETFETTRSQMLAWNFEPAGCCNP